MTSYIQLRAPDGLHFRRPLVHRKPVELGLLTLSSSRLSKAIVQVLQAPH